MFDKAILKEPSRLLRSTPVKSQALRIDRSGGAYGAGIIREAAVITRGVALGHDMWIDDVMLQQTADAINNAASGSKSRFTHPSLSGDGLGKALGRFRNADVDNDIVRADLHFFETAHRSPDGDLAAYVMDLADEDPTSFGTSIAFEPDLGAEKEFVGANSDKDGEFTSPDEDNGRNYPHARLAELEAVDFVDEPAANPDGLFHRGDKIAIVADEAASFIFGLSDEAPVGWDLPVDPQRLRAFLARWLDAHGLCVASRTVDTPATPTVVYNVQGRRRRGRQIEVELEQAEAEREEIRLDLQRRT